MGLALYGGVQQLGVNEKISVQLFAETLSPFRKPHGCSHKNSASIGCGLSPWHLPPI
jgi:hypothetical protein